MRSKRGLWCQVTPKCGRSGDKGWVLVQCPSILDAAIAAEESKVTEATERKADKPPRQLPLKNDCILSYKE